MSGKINGNTGASEVFQSFLKEGENILWSGKPIGGIQIRDADIILIPVSIILLGFSVMLNYILIHFGSDFISQFIGVVIAVAAIYLGCIRFIADLIKRKRTFYCVTTRSEEHT